MKKTGRYPSSDSRYLVLMYLQTVKEKHAPTYCHPCHPCRNNIIYFSKKAQKNSTQYNPQIVIATWGLFCLLLSESPSRSATEKRYTPGRPKNFSPLAIIAHIKSIVIITTSNDVPICSCRNQLS